MDNYVLKHTEEAKEDIACTSNTPAADYLFDINNHTQLLYNYTKKYFHTMTSKLLFLSKIDIPDL